MPIISEEKRCFYPSIIIRLRIIPSYWLCLDHMPTLGPDTVWGVIGNRTLWLIQTMWQKVPPDEGRRNSWREVDKWNKSSVLHKKKKEEVGEKGRNSRLAETRDIYVQCSMNLLLGNNQGCERVTRLFIRKLFIIL